MSLKSLLVVTTATLLMQPVFADDDMGNNTKPCMPVVKACMKAGYRGHGNSGKQFWMGCMKPLLMNNTVKGVTVNASDVKACRDGKVTEMQKELDDLKSVQ